MQIYSILCFLPNFSIILFAMQSNRAESKSAEIVCTCSVNRIRATWWRLYVGGGIV